MSNKRKLRVGHCGGFSRPREQWTGKVRGGARSGLAAEMNRAAATFMKAFGNLQTARPVVRVSQRKGGDS